MMINLKPTIFKPYTQRLINAFIRDCHITKAGIGLDGNIYLADSLQQCVWKTNEFGSCIVASIENGLLDGNDKAAGAMFNTPVFLGVDDENNCYCYIQDGDTGKIKRVSPLGHTVTVSDGLYNYAIELTYHYAEWCVINDQVLFLYVSKTKNTTTLREALGLTNICYI